MYRSQRPVQAPTSGPEDGGTNNVTGLISKFEVRNYPINRGSVGSLTDAVPGAKVPGKPIERYEAYHQRYNSSGYGTPREIRTPDHGSRYPVSRYGSNLLDSQAYFSDSAESVPQKIVTAGMAATRSARTGAPQHFYHNGSLSSLNESDYYEDMYEDTRPHVRRGSGRPTISHGDAAGFLETEEDEATPMTQERVATSLSRFGAILQMLCRIPFPRMSVTGMGLCSLVAIFFFPRAIGSNILFPGFRLLFGTLYPAYASYKAVRTKNVKEYVKWMMYWIVFAFFTCIETFTDILLSWFPFYYEIKVIIVLWLLSPATRGSSTLYRKFVHPMLTRREQEIDDYINQAKEKGYTAVLQLGSKGVNYATNVIMQTAIKGGGGLVQTLRKSYSLSDLSEPDTQRTQDEVDEIVPRSQRVLRSKSSRSSSGNRQMDMYFPEVEIAGTPYQAAAPPPYNYIRSSDDISSGYSSAEPGLSRTASMSNTARPRLKSKTREDGYEIDEGRFEYYDREGNNSYAFGGGPPRASIYEVPVNGSLPAITQAGETFITQQQIYPGAAPIYSNASKSFEPSLANVPLEEREKYRKFLQWMEQQQRQEVKDQVEQVPMEVAKPKVVEIADVTTTVGEKQENPTQVQLDDSVKTKVPTSEVISERSQTMDDEFQDTISLSSNDEDDFQEIEMIEPEGQAVVIENNVPTEAKVEVSVSTVNDSSSLELLPAVAIDQANGVVEAVPTTVVEEEVITSGPTTADETVPERTDASETVATDEKIVTTEDKILEMVPSSVSVPETNSSVADLSAAVQESTHATLLECPATNLASSTSSLALSECSASSGPIAQPRKHASFGKQRMAPPVPPSPVSPQPPAPEMLVIRERSAVPKANLAAPPVAPSRGQSVERKSTNVSAGSSSPSSVSSSDKNKSKKFMSSLTGMFKGHGGDGTSGCNRARDASPLPAASGHPRETQI
ncbi:uncharacterized protein LOC118464639 isoform X2 [Anopheles albimanus]|uniref:uncharacterized protein LOC118464639 isoform X2 n=1 Tax=Anopheles albimanus TaxID=7167 RepID=UPI0016407F84|nr:uncharacterized protein LOC118464639 isoform X2 [Anopheles albimanus]